MEIILAASFLAFPAIGGYYLVEAGIGIVKAIRSSR